MDNGDDGSDRDGAGVGGDNGDGSGVVMKLIDVG